MPTWKFARWACRKWKCYIFCCILLFVNLRLLSPCSNKIRNYLNSSRKPTLFSWEMKYCLLNKKKFNTKCKLNCNLIYFSRKSKKLNLTKDLFFLNHVLESSRFNYACEKKIFVSKQFTFFLKTSPTKQQK